MILINQAGIVRFFCLFFIFLSSVSSAHAVSILNAHLTGGGYVILKTEPGAAAVFRQQTFLSDDKGYIAIGFGRDLSGEQAVQITHGEKEESLTLTIASRQYPVQYIKGIPKALVTPPQSRLDRIYREAQAVKEARAVQSKLNFWRVEPFKWPLRAPLSGVYGSQRFYNGEPRSPHWGVDLAAPTGTAVHAPAGGRVVLAEPDLYFSGGTVIVDHGGGLSSSFLHLSKLNVQVGDLVQQGDIIAEVGATGRVTGPHLDWRMNLNGERIDAALWVAEPHS